MDRDWLADAGALTLHGGPWTAHVVPRYGMNTLSLRCSGRDVLRTPTDLASFLQLPEGYGTPPLLPANRTRDGVFSFGGRVYQLPVNDTRFHTHKHGTLHISPFTVTERTDAGVSGYLDNTGELYPFPFRMTIRCCADAEGYHQSYTLRNTGAGSMPVIFAIHAAFRAPRRCRIPVRQICLADERCLPTGQLAPVPPSLQPYVDGTQPHGTPVGFCCPAAGRRAELDELVYEVSPQFTHWIVWNGDGHQDFLCVEPQTAASNALQRPGEAMVLRPEESVCFSTRIHTRDVI